MEEGVNRTTAPGHPSFVSGGLNTLYQQMERRKWSILFSLCLLLACFGDQAVAQKTCPGQDGLLTAWTGYVRSANFGSAGASYTNNLACRWHIRVAEGNRVRLTKVDFELEGRGPGNRCYDWLKVYDGSDETAPLIGQYCGMEFPNEIMSTGKSVYLHFETDTTDSFRGFSINYAGVCSGLTIDVPVDGTGLIETPLYPANYPALITCDWTLQTQPGYRIDVDFEVFDLGSASNCTTAYVQVYGGSDTAADRLAKFCGAELQTASPLHAVSSSSSTAHLTFKGAAEPGTGFRLAYSTEVLGCTSSPCQNGGSCTNVDLDFTCNCTPGWKGKACDQNIDDCQPWPCGQHGVNCQDLVNGFTCTCVAGYDGPACDVADIL
ncbi:tolloid-like protein 1 [Acanthaster planci]|uniref:Tolloid-like protein 1 n=1 Tax=Acanthaster planci TaxID=133434 RepID=A0A8B7XHS1_ACAPL|nr:tolloid-like protein 1 [Acanthaster planci]